MLSRPGVHPDLATPAAFASADQDAATRRIEVALGEREGFVDPHPRALEQDDQRSGPQSGRSAAGETHDWDDLLDRRRVGRVGAALVTWRAAAMKARHGRRRPAATSGI